MFDSFESCIERKNMKYTKFVFGGLLTTMLLINHALAANTLEKNYGIKGPKLEATPTTASVQTYEVKGKVYKTLSDEKFKEYSVIGVASYYGSQFNGRKTASGDIFNENLLTAAHKRLPLNSYVLVTNLNNGRKVVVKVNDRGPFTGDRKIDLSKAAARELGMLRHGVAKVKIEVVNIDSDGSIGGPGGETLQQLAQNQNPPLPISENNGVELAKKINNLPVQNTQQKSDTVDTSKPTDKVFELQSVNLASDKQAQELIAQLAMDNVDSEILSNDDGYKVKFGPIMSQAMVNQLKMKLAQAGYHNNILYSHNTK